MANKTITQLDTAQSLNDNMVIPVELNGNTYKAFLGSIKTYCQPSGSITITENGTHDVIDYAEAIVNVEAKFIPTGSITITENGTHDVTDYAEAVVNVPSPQPNIIVNTNIDNEISLQNNSKYVCSNNNLYEYTYSNNLMFPLSVENTFLFNTFISNGAFYINANKLSNNPNSEGSLWCSTAFYDGYDRIVFIDITVEDNNDIGWFMIHTGADWDFNKVIWSLPDSSGNFIIPIFLNSITNCFAFGIGNGNSLKGDEIHINRIYEYILPGIPTGS